MTTDWRRVEEIFHSAREMAPDERAAFLASACAGDSSLHDEVESLLAADGSDSDLPNPFVSPRDLAPAHRFDRYEIVARCGQGATGTVYRAHDSESGTDV